MIEPQAPARAPLFPRWMHVVFGVLAAGAAVAATVNALVAGSLRAHALHGGLAVCLVVWSVIELASGGRRAGPD
jgi:hypothetical protein